MNSAFQLTLHDYSASIDCGFNAPVRSDDQTVSRRVDGAFYPAIYIKAFAAREFAEVNDDIVTLFTPASQSSSRAMANFVQCDKMHFLEVANGGCPVQIKILERYGSAVDYGEAKTCHGVSGWHDAEAQDRGPADGKRADSSAGH